MDGRSFVITPSALGHCLGGGCRKIGTQTQDLQTQDSVYVTEPTFIPLEYTYKLICNKTL